MNSSDARILIVDNLLNRIYRSVEALKSDYPNLELYNNETEFNEALLKGAPDIILLNLDLTPNDAVILAREIRRQFPASPPYIVIYSDKQDDFVQELAYNSGVDAFINFHLKSAILKVFIQRLLIRRTSHQQVNPQKVIIDSERFLIFKYGEALQLPRKEFRLFELLYNNSERFFSKSEIAETIWQDSNVAKKRAIDVHIYNIRQLFGKRIIQSQKGKGYRMNKKVLG